MSNAPDEALGIPREQAEEAAVSAHPVAAPPRGALADSGLGVAFTEGIVSWKGSGKPSGESSTGTGVSMPGKSWSGGGGHEGVMERAPARGLEATQKLALGVTERLPRMLAAGEDARLISHDSASSEEVSGTDDGSPRDWYNVLPRVTRLCEWGGLMPADASATATRQAAQLSPSVQ
eukprot:gene1099-1652_t